MGVGVSNWRLARAVSLAGGLGVVSGTALEVVAARRLQCGDEGGHMRRALAAFPFPEMARRMWERFFIPGGKAPSTGFVPLPLPNAAAARLREEWTVVAAFCEVYLAREGHGRPVGFNLLEKIQVPTLCGLFGAMLAGAEVVLMGAGIPRQIPGILDRLAAGEEAVLKLDVQGAETGVHEMRLDPRTWGEGPLPELRRPLFLGIVGSSTLAQALARKASGRVDGFVVEGQEAGGHNAPPRGGGTRTAEGEPVYGPRDRPDLAAFRALGRPFWLAGGYGRPGRLAAARAEGAQGIQAGTIFAFCEESGITPEIKRRVLAESRAGTLRVFTDPEASPTGFPFKIVRLAGSMAEAAVAARRGRVCDLGFLRTLALCQGKLVHRCPGEPVEDYLAKGGAAVETVGRICVCNGLLGTIGLGQVRLGEREPCLVTAGQDAEELGAWFPAALGGYAAAEAVECLMEGMKA